MVNVKIQEYENRFYILTIEEKDAFCIKKIFEKSDESISEIEKLTKTNGFAFDSTNSLVVE